MPLKELAYDPENRTLTYPGIAPGPTFDWGRYMEKAMDAYDQPVRAGLAGVLRGLRPFTFRQQKGTPSWKELAGMAGVTGKSLQELMPQVDFPGKASMVGSMARVPLDEAAAAGASMVGDPTNFVPPAKFLGLAGLFGGAGAKHFAKARKFSSLADKMPRFEISDIGMKVKGSYAADKVLKGRNTFRLTEVVDHPELYKNYPELDNTAVVFSDIPVGSGSFNPESNIITVSNKLKEGEDIKNTLTHEIQHWIQEKEGFAKGGSPKQFTQADDAKLARDALVLRKELKRPSNKGKDKTKIIDKYLKDWQDLSGKPMHQDAKWVALDIKENPDSQLKELVNLYGLDRRVSPDSPRNLYSRLAGEAEARDASARMGMTEAQRMKTQPLESTGLGLADLIVRGQSSGPMMSTGRGVLRPLITSSYKHSSQFPTVSH